MISRDLLSNPIAAGDKVLAVNRHVPTDKTSAVRESWTGVVVEIKPHRYLGFPVAVVRKSNGNIVDKLLHNLLVVDKTWTNEMLAMHSKVLFGADVEER